MKENDSIDSALEHSLQDHYAERYGQPPAVAPFWVQLSAHLEKSVQRPSWRQRQLNALRRVVSWQKEPTLSPEISREGIHDSRPRVGRVGTWVAVFLLTIVVGSMLLVFNMAHKSQSATQTARGSDIYFVTTSGQVGQTGFTTTINCMDKTSHVLLWQRSVIGLNSAPVIAGNTAYVTAFDIATDRSSMVAVNLQDGSILWDAEVGSPNFLTDPAVADGAVYVMQWTGKIYSLDSKTGKRNWVYDTKLVPHMSGGLLRPGSVTVANGVVYNTVLNTLVAVDAEKGTLLWSHKVDNALLFSSPTAAGGVVYVSSHTENGFGEGPNQSGFVYAYDAHSGAQKWVYPIDAMLTDTPTIAGKLVVFGSAHDSIYALNAENGKKVWQYSVGQESYTSPVVADGVVYTREDGSINGDTSVGSTKPSLLALDLATGKKLWSVVTDVVVNAGDVKDGTIYAGGAPDQLEALSAINGTELWHITVVSSSPPFVWLVS